MYKKFWKRFLDFIISFCALIVLSPLLVTLTCIGAIKMHGNPIFIQERPGKDEKIFRMIKFRTMTNEHDPSGRLLADDKRLNSYGRFLRSTSLDELLELLNILMGHMSIVGPRPLLLKYLPYYSERERLRHTVRPGLTGYAQVHGRNNATWDDRFEMDVKYTENISFRTDCKIMIDTVRVSVCRTNVQLNALEDFNEYRKTQR